jgi:hypothetical protein
MRPRRGLRAAMSVFFLFVVGACSSDDSSKKGLGEECRDNNECESDFCAGPMSESSSVCAAKKALLERCSEDYECIGGMCEHVTADRICSASCSTEEDCGGSPCFFHKCTTPCVSHDELLPGFVCIDNRPVSCDEAKQTTDAYCEICGCAEGTRCDSASCVPLLGLGQECGKDSDCESANCGVAKSDSTGTYHCLVALTTPCTDDDCASCVHGEQATFCSRICDDDWDHHILDCEDPPNLELLWICAGQDSYFCHVDCTQDLSICGQWGHVCAPLSGSDRMYCKW